MGNIINIQPRKKKLSFGDWITASTISDDPLLTIKKHAFDFPLCVAVIALCLFGIVMLFSASYYYAQSEQGNGYYYVINQGRYLIVGLVIMFVVSHVPYTFYSKRWVYLLLYATLICLLVIVLLFGSSAQGAQRWIKIGPITIQPSELARFILVIALTNYAIKNRRYMNRFFRGMVPMMLLAAVPCLLIILQPNLSMVIIICLNLLIMLMVSGCNLLYFAGMIGIGIAGIILYLNINGGYQLSRFEMAWASWDKLMEYAGNEAYQIVQAFYAFANGGWFGQGFDASRQKLLFLPYRESDYILPIIAEELGFIAVVLLIAAYAFVIHRGVKIARTCPDRFGSILAVGMTGTLAVQVIINIAVVVGLLPATGQTLPFISSGGTSLVSFLTATGVLLNVSRYTERTK